MRFIISYNLLEMDFTKKIINYIKENKCVDDVMINDSFEYLEFDKWDLICLFDFIEDEFKVPVHYDFIHVFKTIKEVVSYVEQEATRRGLSR